jgi:hypothetical protein
LKEIREWMRAKGYRIWYKDKSDSVFVQQKVIPVTWIENLSLLLYNFYLWLRKAKGYIMGK